MLCQPSQAPDRRIVQLQPGTSDPIIENPFVFRFCQVRLELLECRSVILDRLFQRTFVLLDNRLFQQECGRQEVEQGRE